MAHPLDEVFKRYRDRGRDEAGGLLMLLNVGSIEDGGREIAPDLVLRQATAEEREEILLLMRYYLGPASIHHIPWDHNVEYVPHDDGKGGHYNWDPLPAGEHRYHVLEFKGSNYRSHLLLEAAALAIGPRIVGGYALHWGHALGAGGGPFFAEELDDLRWKTSLVTLSTELLDDLSSVFPRFLTHDESVIGVHRAVEDLRAISQPRMPLGLKLLGYFGILESLLAHKPEPDDRYSSITRQLKMKLNLLSKRLARPIDLTFAGLTHEQTWSAMYELRSAVAHGTKPNFEKKPLAPLKHREAHLLRDAVAFVQEVVRSVIRQAMEEPQLVADLRKC